MEDHHYFSSCRQVTSVRPTLSRSNLQHADLGEDTPRHPDEDTHPASVPAATDMLLVSVSYSRLELSIKCIVQSKLTRLRYEIESSIFLADSLNSETYRLDDYSHARCLGEVT